MENEASPTAAEAAAVISPGRALESGAAEGPAGRPRQGAPPPEPGAGQVEAKHIGGLIPEAVAVAVALPVLVGELDQGAPRTGVIDLETVVVAAQLLMRLAQAGGRRGRLGQGEVQVRDIVEQTVAGAPVAAEGAGEGQVDLLRVVFLQLRGGAGIVFQHPATIDPQPLAVAQPGTDVDVVIAVAAAAVGDLGAQGISGEVPPGDLEGLACGPCRKRPGEGIGEKDLAGHALYGDEVEVGEAGERIVKAKAVIDHIEPVGRGCEESAQSRKADAAAVLVTGAGQKGEEIPRRAVAGTKPEGGIGRKGGRHSLPLRTGGGHQENKPGGDSAHARSISE